MFDTCLAPSLLKVTNLKLIIAIFNNFYLKCEIKEFVYEIQFRKLQYNRKEITIATALH